MILTGNNKVVIIIMLLLAVIIAALAIENTLLSNIWIALSGTLIFILIFSGKIARVIKRIKLKRIISKAPFVNAKVLKRIEFDKNIIILQLEAGKKEERFKTTISIDKRDVILGVAEEYLLLSEGDTASFYQYPGQPCRLLPQLKKIKIQSPKGLWSWLAERWWVVFVLPGIAGPAFGILSALTPNYYIETLQYVSAEKETIWELSKYSKNSDENPGGTYKIIVLDAKSGKKIKKIKRKYHTKTDDFKLVQANSKVWVIGRGYDHEPVVDVYDANNYKKLDMLGSLQTKYPELEAGVISGELVSSYSKTYDNMYGDFFTLPADRILQLKTADAKTCFLDIQTEKFYGTDTELYWDLCLAGYSMIDSYGTYMYYLVYETDSNFSTLYRGKPTEQIYSYFHNTYPQSFDNEYQQEFRKYIGLKKWTYNKEFKDAKIVYQDEDVLCVLHNTPDGTASAYRITFFNHDGNILAEADLSKFENYSCYANREIMPYSIRTENLVKFRIKNMGIITYNIESKQIEKNEFGNCPSVQPQYLFTASRVNSEIFNLFCMIYEGEDLAMYANDLSNFDSNVIKDIPGMLQLRKDLFFRYASIIYQNGSMALVFYSHIPGDDTKYRIAAFDYNGKELFAFDKTDFPNIEKFDETYKNNKTTAGNTIKCHENDKNIILLFDRLGALGLSKSNGEIQWRYEVKL